MLASSGWQISLDGNVVYTDSSSLGLSGLSYLRFDTGPGPGEGGPGVKAGVDNVFIWGAEYDTISVEPSTWSRVKSLYR